jgi:hypothetical protein
MSLVYTCSTSKNIHTKGVKTWTSQKENNAKGRESFVLKQTYCSVNNNKVRAWKYTDLRSSVVMVSKREQLPEDGQVRPKQVAINVILMLF